MFEGEEAYYGSGGRRVVQTLVVNVPIDAKEAVKGGDVKEGGNWGGDEDASGAKLAWMTAWLKQFGFEQKGCLEEVGHKLNLV